METWICSGLGAVFLCILKFFFPEHRLSSALRKVLHFFFSLLVGLDQLFCFVSINLHTFFSGMLFRGCEGAGIQKT